MSKSKPRIAMFAEPLEEQRVRCGLCGHGCVIAQDQFGICRVRQNVAGQLVSLNYDALIAMNVDPIEKKPLFHFLPGSKSLSIAAAGCNFQCAFCQNWQISQAPREGGKLNGQEVSPQQIVEAARHHGCQSISYTYTEPTVYFELAYDTALLAKNSGIRNVFVSNGYMTPQAVEAVAHYLDAINVDLKSFRDATYRRVMKARLQPVLDCLKSLIRCKVWTEITTLIVPDMNDSQEELRDIATFIADELSPDVPWHVSRFHGDYQMESVPSTPVSTLHMAVEIGRQAGLRYVYSGNVPGDDHESTFGPNCREMLIRRQGFTVRENRMANGACPNCRTAIAGTWE
jgi:pyruvate formate lyase activating enzyme